MSKLNLFDVISAFGMSEGEFTAGTVPNRDNNPTDLDYAGQQGATQDGRFAKFSSLQMGVAAGLRQVIVDAERGQTFRQLCATWAPKSDGNNPTQYCDEAVRRVKAVSGFVIDPDVPFLNYFVIEAIP